MINKKAKSPPQRIKENEKIMEIRKSKKIMVRDK